MIISLISQSAFGFVAILVPAWLVSGNRRVVAWRTVIAGILIGGLATMAPERRDGVVAPGMKSIIAGTVATCMTGAVVGMLWTD